MKKFLISEFFYIFTLMKVLKFLLDVIRSNIGKTITLFFVILFSITAHHYWNINYYDSGHVYDEFKQSGKYYYTVLANGETNPKIISFDTKQTIKDNYMTWQEINPSLVLSMIGLVILLIVLLIASFIEDGWELKETWAYISFKEIKCYEQGEEFWYVYHGKLIRQSKYILDEYHIKDAFSRYLKNPNHYPQFESKQEKRDRLINKLIN